MSGFDAYDEPPHPPYYRMHCPECFDRIPEPPAEERPMSGPPASICQDGQEGRCDTDPCAPCPRCRSCGCATHYCLTPAGADGCPGCGCPWGPARQPDVCDVR